MKRKMVTIILAVMVSVMILFTVAYTTNRPAEATTPVAADGICLPPICVEVPTTIQLPGVTITKLITVKPVTVKVPVTVSVRVPPVTEIITLPPVVRTIIQPGEGSTRTVTVPPGAPVTRVLPGSTSTATVVVNREVISNGNAPPITREVRTTLPGRQSTVTSATVVPSKEVVRIPGTTKTVTRFQAVGLSLLGL